MNDKTRIEELEAEIARLKKLGRCPHPPKPGIGGCIQRLRHGRQLSIGELSAASGVSKGLLSKLERDDEPNLNVNTLRRISEGIGCKASDILAAVEAEEEGLNSPSVPPTGRHD